MPDSTKNAKGAAAKQMLQDASSDRVYVLEIHRQEKRWPEAGQREIKWFRPEEATALADEAELSGLIAAFVAHRAKSALVTTAPEKRNPAGKKFQGKQ